MKKLILLALMTSMLPLHSAEAWPKFRVGASKYFLRLLQSQSAVVDPFDPGVEDAVDAEGENQGKALDITSKRAIGRLTAEEAKSFFNGEVPQGQIIKNVFHNGKFYVAVIPAYGPRHVIVQLEHFAPEWIAGHTQLRFSFDQPVKLYESKMGKDVNHAKPEYELHDLLFSAEYHAPKGVKYDLLGGAKEGNFNLVHRLTSMEAKVDSMIRDQGHTVDQWRLELFPDQREHLFETALARAEEAGYKESYHTITKSCTTELWDILDKGLKFKRLAPTFLSRIPVTVRFAIWWRMISAALRESESVESTQLPTLNAETGAVKGPRSAALQCSSIFQF